MKCSFPSPYWVSYPEQVKLAGGVNKIIRGEEANGFKITPQQLEAAIGPQNQVLVLNCPSNPAGHAYTPEELKALADVVAKHPNLVVFSDEIYEKLVYDGLKFVSFATLHPQLARADADLQLPQQKLRDDRLAHRLHRRPQAGRSTRSTSCRAR